MEEMKVSVAAKRLHLSKVSVHKWIKRLTLIEKGLARKENGAILLTAEALRVIEKHHLAKNPDRSNTASGKDVNPGVKVSEKGHNVNDKVYERLEERIDQEITFLRGELSRRDETINQLLTNQAEERQRTDSIIMKLAHDLEGTRKAALAIEAKVNSLAEKKKVEVDETLQAKPKPFKPWKPSKTSDPLEGLSWFEKLWVQIAHPERCRKVVGEP